MTHRGGLSLSIIIWRIVGGQVSFCPGAQNTLGGPDYTYHIQVRLYKLSHVIE